MYQFELRPFKRANLFHSSVFEGETDGHSPVCEILNEEKAFFISLDIPGMTQEEIDIQVKDNHLIVTGERKVAFEKSDTIRNEKRYGKFSRVFSLPPNLNTDGIEATYKNGVLDILLPKEEKTQAKKIQIMS